MLSSWQSPAPSAIRAAATRPRPASPPGSARSSSSSASYAELRRRAGFEPGVAPFPHYDDFEGAPRNTLVGGVALWVMAGKPKLEYRGAAQFLAYLAQPGSRPSGNGAPGPCRSRRPPTTSGSRRALRVDPGQEVAVRSCSSTIGDGLRRHPPRPFPRQSPHHPRGAGVGLRGEQVAAGGLERGSSAATPARRARRIGEPR